MLEDVRAGSERFTEREADSHPEEANAADGQGERVPALEEEQYSLGETGEDAAQEGFDAAGLKNPVFQKFQSVLHARFGTNIIVADLENGVRSYYDAERNRLFISSKMGTGEAMRQALCHELTHFIEGSSGYNAYQEVVLQAAYGRDAQKMSYDIERIKEAYEPVYARDGRNTSHSLK